MRRQRGAYNFLRASRRGASQRISTHHPGSFSHPAFPVRRASSLGTAGFRFPGRGGKDGSLEAARTPGRGLAEQGSGIETVAFYSVFG